MRACGANIQHAATKVTNIEDLVFWLRLLVFNESNRNPINWEFLLDRFVLKMLHVVVQ